MHRGIDEGEAVRQANEAAYDLAQCIEAGMITSANLDRLRLALDRNATRWARQLSATRQQPPTPTERKEQPDGPTRSHTPIPAV
jgi:hypothetical protein